MRYPAGGRVTMEATTAAGSPGRGRCTQRVLSDTAARRLCGPTAVGGTARYGFIPERH